MSKKHEAMINAYNQLKNVVYKLHPEHSKEYYECILNAWDYINDHIANDDFMRAVTDQEIKDEYVARFGHIDPSDLEIDNDYVNSRR